MFCAIGLLITLTLQSPVVVTGRVIDASGAAVAGARITVTPDGAASGIEAFSDAEGRFSVANVPEGPFRLDVAADGFVSQRVTGVAPEGGVSLAPIRLTVAGA